MNLLGIYTVGVARSLCRRLITTRHSNRKLSIVMALSTTFTQWTAETTKFGKITQNKGHFAVQGHSRSPDFDSNRKFIYDDFLWVINTSLPPILHRWRDMAFEMSKITIFGYPSCISTPERRGCPGTISVKFSVDVNVWPRYQMAKKNCRKFQPAE